MYVLAYCRQLFNAKWRHLAKDNDSFLNPSFEKYYVLAGLST